MTDRADGCPFPNKMELHHLPQLQVGAWRKTDNKGTKPMKRLVSRFLTSESGAVLADYVVLTAALVGLSMMVIGIIGNGVTSYSETIPAVMSTY